MEFPYHGIETLKPFERHKIIQFELLIVQLHFLGLCRKSSIAPRQVWDRVRCTSNSWLYEEECLPSGGIQRAWPLQYRLRLSFRYCAPMPYASYGSIVNQSLNISVTRDLGVSQTGLF